MQLLELSVCGGNGIGDREALGKIQTPQATRTHCPVDHKWLVDKVSNRLEENNLKILQEVHTTSHEGQRYFGLMQVQDTTRPEGDRGTVVGVRNSHDKRFCAGIMVGDAPFVCTNLIFSNEIVLSKKHTKNCLNPEMGNNLFDKINDAIGRLRLHWAVQDGRSDVYKEHEVGTLEAHDLMVRSMKEGIIGATKIPQVLEQWEKPNHPEFKDRNLYSLYNSFSEVWKGSNLHTLGDRSIGLNKLFDAQSSFDPSSFSVEDVLELEAPEEPTPLVF